MKYLVYPFIILIFIFSGKVSALNEADEEAAGVIRGMVVDQGSNQPMEYANIAVYSISDSSLVTGSITDASGKFEIRGVEFGNYYIIANFIGFSEIKINDVNLNRENRVYETGTIKLHPSSTELEGVEVVADKSPIEYKLDKKVVNVSQVITAIGGTAVDVLENTPSVQVDIDGNVSLRGSSNFTVLIDGRPSVLSGSEALRQIPSSAIESIEIITNPSAKYEPDGMAGIINLVMKKNAMNGFNGIVNASIGSRDKYRGDFTINYRQQKFNIFLGADWRDETRFGNMTSERETFSNDTTEFLNIYGNRDGTRSGHNFKAGFDYYLSDNTTITLSGELGKSKGTQDGGGRTYNFTIPASERIYSITDEVSERVNDFYSGTLNFQHKFNNEGHRLEAMAFYSGEVGDDSEIESEVLADENFISTGNYIERVSSLETEDEKEFRFKLDYTYPFSEDGRLEAGLQSRIENEMESLAFRDFDQESNTWIINEQFSSTTDFRRDIHAIYSTYANKVGGLEYMAGLRGELTNREIKNTGVAQTSSLDRFDLFPTLHLSYPIKEKIELMASYSRRIDRPGGWDLNPIPSYFNRYTIRLGNPDLLPEYTNSYEFGGMKRFGKGRSYVSLDAFHRVTNNKIDRIQTLGDDGVFYLRSENFDRDYSTGLEATGNLDITQWFLLNASLSLYQYKISGQLNEESFTRTSSNWNGRVSSTFKFSDNSRMQLMTYFRGPSVSAQGETEAMIFSNASYRHEFFNKKLSATLSIQDPLGMARFEGRSYGENFNSYFRWEREPRVVRLTLSYIINNFRSEERRNGDGEGGGDVDMGGGEF